MLSTISFSIIIFTLVFFYIRHDLIALRKIADSFQRYLLKKEIEPITQSGRLKEISTIAKVANQMFINMAEHVEKLKSFNHKLENRVKEEISKQQNQELMMIHQSRQAAMGEMLESIAHQWRQPLNIIGLATANLETEYELGLMNEKNFHEKMNIVSLNINYMSDTIDDFRNFLNPNTEMNYFNVQKSINDVLAILNAQLKNYMINCSVEVDSDIQIYGVTNEFKQVILILLNNSKDAIKIQMDKNNITKGSINILLKSQNNNAIIALSDNGMGIKTDIIESIFNPYYSTKSNLNGTGIGLYVAKNIIESRMNGKISVENTKTGCCFSMSLPLKSPY